MGEKTFFSVITLTWSVEWEIKGKGMEKKAWKEYEMFMTTDQLKKDNNSKDIVFVIVLNKR